MARSSLHFLQDLAQNWAFLLLHTCTVYNLHEVYYYYYLFATVIHIFLLHDSLLHNIIITTKAMNSVSEQDILVLKTSEFRVRLVGFVQVGADVLHHYGMSVCE